jgi:hypothetical protein
MPRKSEPTPLPPICTSCACLLGFQANVRSNELSVPSSPTDTTNSESFVILTSGLCFKSGPTGTGLSPSSCTQSKSGHAGQHPPLLSLCFVLLSPLSPLPGLWTRTQRRSLVGAVEGRPVPTMSLPQRSAASVTCAFTPTDALSTPTRHLGCS